MKIESLDPRVSRLGINPDNADFRPLTQMDDLETYQVFVRLKEKRPLLHVGIVHSPNLEIAFMSAKEQYSRRLSCTELWVVSSEEIFSSNYAYVKESVYDLPENGFETGTDSVEGGKFEVFHQAKRGAQQKYAGSVDANSLKEGFKKAKEAFSADESPVSLWIVDASKIRKSNEEDIAIWSMLDEKRYRDAVVYKVKHKIEAYKVSHLSGK